MLVNELIDKIKDNTRHLENTILNNEWNDKNYKHLVQLINQIKFNCDLVKEIKRYLKDY